MSQVEVSYSAAAHGLQRGESIAAFRQRMDGLACLELDIRTGRLDAAEAASRLRELMIPDAPQSLARST
ncbi:MAG: hypothetical protein GC155_07970 [Alphaproteobacteria bacterium]|nr:hypothetical protein [Alphaproteobacteria bacterium]